MNNTQTGASGSSSNTTSNSTNTNANSTNNQVVQTTGTGPVALGVSTTSAKNELKLAKGIRTSARKAATRKMNQIQDLMKDANTPVEDYEDALTILLDKEESLIQIDARVEALIEDEVEMEQETNAAIIYREDITTIRLKVLRIIQKAHNLASHSTSSSLYSGQTLISSVLPNYSSNSSQVSTLQGVPTNTTPAATTNPAQPNANLPAVNSTTNPVSQQNATLPPGNSTTNPVSQQIANLPPGNTTTTVTRPEVRLPPLPIVPFNGEFSKWSNFWGRFQATIDSNVRISKVEKFIYLTSYLEGEARKAVEGLVQSDASYDLAVDLLKKRFERSDLAIHSHMNKLLEIQPVVNSNNLKALRKLLNTCEVSIRSLKALGVETKEKASFLCPALLRCLPNDIRTEYCVKNKPTANQNWDADKLIEFIREQIESREMADTLSAAPSKAELEEKSEGSRKNEYQSYDKFKPRGKTTSRHLPSASTLTTGTQRSTGYVYCIFCKSRNHRTTNCQSHTFDQKRVIIKDSGRCFICLRYDHDMKNCQSKFKTCRECDKKHNYALCEKNPVNIQKETTPKESESVASNAAPVQHHDNKQNKIVILQTAKALVRNCSNPKEYGKARCLLDGGSQVSFVKKEFSRKLNLPVIGSQMLDVYSFGAKTPSKNNAKRVKIILENREDPTKTVEIIALELPFLCHVFTDVKNNDLDKLIESEGMQMADDQWSHDQNSEIDILIGADFYWEVVTENTKRFSPSLVALETKLGWCFQGPISNQLNHSTTNLVTTNLVTVGQKRINDSLKKFFDLESMGINNKEILENVKDRSVTNFFENVHHNGERYSVKFPWETNKENLPDNYQQALKRMRPLTNKFEKNPEYFNEYKKVVENQLKDGIAEEIPPEELKKNIPGTYYMPHQGVVRNNAATTKLRVVFDASSHGYGAPSLNNCLSTGGNLNPDLLLLLLRFRVNKIAVVADIEAAFLQVALDNPDKDSARFLWIKQDENGKIIPDQFRTLRMTRVPFGITSSPFLLACTIKYHIQESKNGDQTVKDKLNNDLYVDDLVSGENDVPAALNLSKGAAKLMRGAGMTLRKWGTNSQELRNEWDSISGPNNPNIFDRISNPVEKVLGLKWDTQSDTFTFSLTNLIDMSKNLRKTKRQVLSFVSQIFDPIGLLSPFTIRAKLLFQSLWAIKDMDWDTELPIEIGQEFGVWCQELSQLPNLKIQRHYFSSTNDAIISQELHCFVDSSKKAYAAVVYIRFETIYQVGSALITAKTRVAPIKDEHLTIPRLELMGCLLGARLTNYIKNTFSKKLTGCYYWTDSTVALAWIKGKVEIWKPFVGNRVSEIQSLTKQEGWFHCPGIENPADLPSRGIKAKDLIKNKLWFSGPSWLKKAKSEWPQHPNEAISTGHPDLEAVQNERRKLTLVVTAVPNLAIQNVVDLARYYQLDTVLRITAYILRFGSRLNSEEFTGPISAEEMERAELLWIKSIQNSEFLSELNCLRNGERVNPNSKIASLSPILNESGIICVGGRLEESSLSYKEKHPIIMPKTNRFSKMLISRSHIQIFHGGISDTCTQLRERYWIPCSRQLARTIVKDCLTCKRIKATLGDAPTAPLPMDRVTESPPFSVLGLDFAGPILVKNYNEMTKSYVLLATCAVTRAIHLELVPSLTCDDFLMAFRRVIARRGIPTTIYSDNAKTFKKADTDLRLIWQTLKTDTLKEFFGTRGIKWKFIVERAAWYGGWWERLVRSTKTTLKRTLGHASLSFVELETILTETEGVINSRPLTYTYNDSNEPLPLTPSDFLIGRRVTALPPISFKRVTIPKGKLDFQNKLKYREAITQKLWIRWKKEYLMELRTAHHAKNNSVGTYKNGDVVVVQDDKIPRHMWKLGVITEVIRGRDNQIRSCVIKTPNGNFIRRSIQHLCNLEICD